MEFKKVRTSPEVWAVIRARHHDQLGVFGSYSYPDGNPYSNPGQGSMYTEWGFKEADAPLLAAESTWKIDPMDRGRRGPETHEYWLCYPVEES